MLKKPNIERSRKEIESLVNKNTGLIRNVINRIVPGNIRKVIYDDVYSEGLLALFRAAELYDPQLMKIPNFSGYASRAIFLRILRFQRTKFSVISVPDHLEHLDKEEIHRGLKNWIDLNAINKAKHCTYLQALKSKDNQYLNFDCYLLEAPLYKKWYPFEVKRFITLLNIFLGYKKALLLRRKYGIDRKSQSDKELAELYGITEQAIWYRIHGAIIKLQGIKHIFDFNFSDSGG